MSDLFQCFISRRGKGMITKTCSFAVALLMIASMSACTGNGSTSSFKLGGAGGTPVMATLTWDAPTTRMDGSLLDPAFDLQAYKIQYGTSSGAYTHSVLVSNPGTTTVTHLFPIAAGTYYVTVTDIDNYGQESLPSAEIAKTF